LLIDTHCHLNLTEHFPDPASEIDFARANGVGKLVVVGVDLETSRIALELAERFLEVYAVVGIHPNHSADYQPSWLSELKEMLVHPKAVALGEIGLDYHWDYATRAQQYASLKDQLALAAEVGCPIVFHCREAYEDLLDILGPHASSVPTQKVLHCFSGTQQDAQRATELDCYFGVDGPITYKSAADLREIVKGLPRDRVVIETDCPYLTPVPHRGKPNRPGYVTFVNNMLASTWGISIEDAAKQATENAFALFPKLH
jgi:TatD DNase family protein